MSTEPEPVETDCWAQGSVPRTTLVNLTPRSEGQLDKQPQLTVVTVVTEEPSSERKQIDAGELEPESSIPVEEANLVEEQQVGNRYNLC